MNTSMYDAQQGLTSGAHIDLSTMSGTNSFHGSAYLHHVELVRKARGEEAHKGGQLIVPGDTQDQCITSWLAGATNAAACQEAIETTP